MRLLAYDKNGKPAIGLRRDEDLVDISEAAPDLPSDMCALLAAPVEDRLQDVLDNPPSHSVRPLSGIKYFPPIWNPGKIICVGLNYEDHAAETKLEKPEYPILFPRFNSTLVAHKQPLIAPKASTEFDYEAELVVVIGKKGRNIERAKAINMVSAYSIFNEGSVRDFQFKSPTWTSGKNFDASGGFGPELVTIDELPPGAQGLGIQTYLNNELLQDGNTADMMFDVSELIYEITKVMTLEAGDLIVSGTPPGVGFVRKPPIFMTPGDICEISIEGIGTLRNPISAEV